MMRVFKLRLSEFWHLLTTGTVKKYRPERHYMRGPGPAYSARYQTPVSAK